MSSPPRPRFPVSRGAAGRWGAAACGAVLGLVCAAAAASSAPGPAPGNISIEGHLAVTLPRPDYRPRPLDDRTELILRVDGVAAANGQFRYQFHYLGFEAGTYNLADFLVRPDGSRPDELGTLPVRIHARLPDDHNGRLNPHLARRFPFLGGYRVMLALLAVLWLAGLAAYILSQRKKRVVAQAAAPVPAPSLAARLRPLVEAAARGRLDAEGQAQLERLLTGYWRVKLALPEGRMAEALRRLKAHAEAGELLRALERWLHRPGGVSAAEVAAVLEPYRHLPVAGFGPEGKGAG
ncbi:MAG: hypothetical protein JXQ71_13740 [Verrucomicrobia bacterium]|nr:hypothetical protein [Verrucomicrobiota bacterium]